MVSDFEFYHGVVLCKIVHNKADTSIRLYSQHANSCYVVNGDIGVFIKHSAKRLSPWQFTFAREHCQHLFEMMSSLRAVFLVLVCKDHGVACLDAEEIEALLDAEHGEVQSVLVSRRPREKFRVHCGPRGRATIKIADNEFPSKIFREL